MIALCYTEHYRTTLSVEHPCVERLHVSCTHVYEGRSCTHCFNRLQTFTYWTTNFNQITLITIIIAYTRDHVFDCRLYTILG